MAWSSRETAVGVRVDDSVGRQRRPRSAETRRLREDRQEREAMHACDDTRGDARGEPRGRRRRPTTRDT